MGTGEKSPRLVRRAPRTARALDPHGVYDARSMARRQLARRRRSLSSVLLLIAFFVAGSLFILKGREPRVPEWAPSRNAPLDVDVTALAALPEPASSSAPSQVLAATLDGRLALLDEQGRALSSWDTADFPLRAPPLIARGLAITGGEDGVLRAFDLTSHLLKWHSEGSSGISGRAVLFTTSSPSAAATPLAQAAPTSASRARSQSAPEATATPSASSSAQEAVAVSDDGGQVRALRLSDGKVLWSVELGAPCGDGLSVTRVSGGRTLILVPLLAGAARRGGVVALEARDGAIAWRYPGDERIFAAGLKPPLVRAVDGRMRLFCADDAGAVSALDAATGRSPASSAENPASRSGAGEWKTFLSPLASGARGASTNPLRRWLSPGEPSTEATPDAEPGAQEANRSALNPLAEAALVSVRVPLLWVSAAQGPLLVVAGNDGGVRALDARSGREAWSTGAGEAPVALLRDPLSRDTASIVIVTPHTVERRDAGDGRRLSRFEWGEDVGRAQAATATSSCLFVAARRLLVFRWASAS